MAYGISTYCFKQQQPVIRAATVFDAVLAVTSLVLGILAATSVIQSTAAAYACIGIAIAIISWDMIAYWLSRKPKEEAKPTSQETPMTIEIDEVAKYITEGIEKNIEFDKMLSAKVISHVKCADQIIINDCVIHKPFDSDLKSQFRALLDQAKPQFASAQVSSKLEVFFAVIFKTPSNSFGITIFDKVRQNKETLSCGPTFVTDLQGDNQQFTKYLGELTEREIKPPLDENLNFID